MMKVSLLVELLAVGLIGGVSSMGRTGGDTNSFVRSSVRWPVRLCLGRVASGDLSGRRRE